MIREIAQIRSNFILLNIFQNLPGVLKYFAFFGSKLSSILSEIRTQNHLQRFEYHPQYTNLLFRLKTRMLLKFQRTENLGSGYFQINSTFPRSKSLEGKVYKMYIIYLEKGDFCDLYYNFLYGR